MNETGQGGGDPNRQPDQQSGGSEDPKQEAQTSGKGPPDDPGQRQEPRGGYHRPDKGDDEEDPCASRDCGDPASTSESRCSCTGGCTCECTMELPEGTMRRVLETLRDELKAPPACAGSPADARTEFGTALDACETEYQGIGTIEQSYRDYFCQIDCELDKAESQCQDMKVWSEQVTSGERDCIEKLWLCCYETYERRLYCDCWFEKAAEYEHLKDCLEQAKTRQARAESDFKAVKEFQATLKARFEELKKLWESAKKKFEAKQYLAVYAILIEYRHLYHTLSRLVLWESLPGVTPGPQTREEYCEAGAELPPATCERPDLGAYDSRWLRKALMAALRNLIRAKYHRYCWHQHWIDSRHCAEQCKADLETFRGSRRDKFILEAQDCVAEVEQEHGDEEQEEYATPQQTAR